MTKTGPKPKLRIVPKAQAADAAAVPSWVPRNVKGDWPRIVGHLQTKGLYDDGMIDVLAAYLSALSTMRRCQSAIQRQGGFFRETGKAPRAHPAFALMEEAEKRLRLNASRLGLIDESRDTARKGGLETLPADDDSEDFGDV